MKSFTWSIALLALLLAAMAMVPMVSATSTSDAYYQNKSILITSFGTLPDAAQKNITLANTGSNSWFTRLQKITNESDSALDKFYYPNGPVIGHGYDRFGNMIVQINKDQNVSQPELKEIYEIIQKTGEKNGIDNISCTFLSLGIMKPESRTDKIRPLIGGLKITSTGGWGTTGFRARDSSGNLGMVTAGHLGNVGDTVYQPDPSVSGSSIGTISRQGSTNSDSAFIPFSNTAATFYFTNTVNLGFSSYSSNPSTGTSVWKSGAATDLSSGLVDFVTTVYNPYFGKRIPNAGWAEYSSADGDSGAPVFTYAYFNPVLVGVHMGRSEPYGIFSSISGVQSDLGVTPAL